MLRSICNHESDSGDRTSAGRMWEKTPSCELSLGHSEGQSRPTGQRATAEGGVKLVDVPSPAFVRKKKINKTSLRIGAANPALAVLWT